MDTPIVVSWRQRVSVAAKCPADAVGVEAISGLSAALSVDPQLPGEEQCWLQIELADALLRLQTMAEVNICVFRADAAFQSIDNPSVELQTGLADILIRVRRHGRAAELIEGMLDGGGDETPDVGRAGNWSTLGTCKEA